MANYYIKMSGQVLTCVSISLVLIRSPRDCVYCLLKTHVALITEVIALKKGIL